VASITGLPALQAGQPAALIYEQGRQEPVAGWVITAEFVQPDAR
jgi:hypothetical protein